MALKGDLASVDLAQVFQMLALNRKVGLLSIQGPGVWKALYFDQRGVTLYYNEHLLLDKVLGNMVRSGHLDGQHVRETREHAANMGQTLIEALLAGGFLTEHDLESSFRAEMEEEIYDLFFWKDARFEFLEGRNEIDHSQGQVNERFFFSTDMLVMEAARRIDEWAFIQERVPGPDEVFCAVESQANVVDFDDSALSVYELVDGKRNVARLIEITALSSFHVYKSLAHLLEQGMIGPVDPSHLVPSAEECIAEGRLQDAINLYERAISLGEGLPDAHVAVASAYEAVQGFESSAQHLRCVAEYYAADEDISGAAATLWQVVEMMPTDLEARERFVELTVGVADLKLGNVDPVAEGKVLVDLYIELGEIERVRGILERLLRDNPDDIDLKRSLISVHTKAGDSRRVMELYESIAEDLVRKGEPIEAIKYLQKILMIDRSRKEISERVRSLYEMDERRRNRRRTMVALAAILCVMGALGGVWYFYDLHAREHFSHLDVSELVEAKEFASAEKAYLSFIESYPLTMVAKEAETELARIQSMRLAHEAQLKQQRIRNEATIGRKRSEYRAEWDAYQQAVGEQDLASALTHLENVRRMVTAIEDAKDQRWAEEVLLEKNLNDLRVYIGEAAALERRSRDLLAKNDWRAARVELLELTSRYEISEVAKRARIPVLVTSSPPGAAVFQAGRPLTASTEGGEVGLVTPAVVFCPATRVHQLELRRQGFLPLSIGVDASAGAESHHVMTVIPLAEVQFDGVPQTGAGARRGHLAVGLRGGKFGVARAGAEPVTVQLPGLSEIQAKPFLSIDRVFLVTNTNELVSYALTGGKPKYTVQLESLPAHDLVGKDGRFVFADENGRLVCIDMTYGRVLWTRTISGDIAGPPTVEDRRVRVGTHSRELLVFDFSDGSLLQSYPGVPDVRSSVYSRGNTAIFASSEGAVVAYNENTRRVAWKADVGAVRAPEDLMVVGDSVLVITDSQRLSHLDASTGATRSTLDLPGKVTSAVPVGRRLYVVVREEAGENEERSLLLAIDAETLRAHWEFRDGGIFLGPVSSDGASAYVPGSDGSLLRFR